MMNYKRQEIEILASRIENEPVRFIQVIYGPRQVGKTTLVQQFLEKTKLPSHYISADAVRGDDGIWISQQWEAARIMAAKSNEKRFVLVVDEVQKIENWSEYVKKEWDKDRLQGTTLHVILLGSSRMMLQKGLTESLAGRYEAIWLGHWSFREMADAFGLTADQYVWFGGYPGAVPLMANESRWKQYVRDSLVEATVSKDILMMTRVDKPALMKNMFELGCEFSGQILSYTKMLGQLHDAGNTTTLSHYLSLLNSAGLLAGLEKFTPNKIRKRASSPKFQVYNTALKSAQSQFTFDEIYEQPSEWGRWVETAAGAHLLNHNMKGDFELLYWRQGNDEVDFVLKKGEKVIGLEVKSSSAKRTSGMKAFSGQFHTDKVLLIGDGGLPWQEFMQINPEELF